MATVNPFDLLGDDDIDDPSTLIAAHQLKVPSQTKKSQSPAATQPQSKPAAKLPSKPLPPAQAVQEAKDGGRGYARGGGGGLGYGRGGRGGGGFNRESNNSENAFGGNRDFTGSRGPIEESDSRSGERRGGGNGGSRVSFRGGRRGGGGGFNDGEAGDGEQPRRVFERRSGTGRGYGMKREGAGRGNWGTPTDELSQVVEEVANEVEKTPSDEKIESAEGDTTEGVKDTPTNETEEKEPENKEMTLEEYEKVLEEKRKALQSLKTEERKVDDKAFASMQPLANKKKNTDDIFIKLGSEKDKKKELAEKEERAKKALSINEFLKPADGERYYSPGGRGGRGGGGRGGRGRGNNSTSNVEVAPSIEDQQHFPTLGAK